MTNLELDPAESRVPAADHPGSVTRLLPARTVPLGGVRGITVRRTLPHREVPSVGAWCFLDHFGPDPTPMRVLPHPHTALQTVTWPLDGEIRHRDSLGSDVLVRPGELNLMTAGTGVAHSEFSTTAGSERGTSLHGLQLWVALPDDALGLPSSFEQLVDLPVVRTQAMAATILVGELAGQRSAATVHTPLLGADITVHPGSDQVLDLDPTFEHAVLLVTGDLTVDGRTVPTDNLLFHGHGRGELTLRTAGGARLILLGGAPFEYDLVMWWNFIGRSHDDIVRDRNDWQAHHERFGEVAGHGTDRIPAPPLPGTRLLPRRRTT
ncbi:MAG TPA: pirin family protein [Candidatus Nanopelagicales bacterium]|jgi:redox-sensitive bicupin YhaK (pirin superfamily)|nr:pirin family protein [Candidatus Nanopelagicales bacterium]